MREAGLEPNERQAKFSSDDVLDSYAEVCRHYGKVPSTAELRFYVRAHPVSLGHNTFVNHFGSKGGLIAALRQRAIECDDNDLLKLLHAEVAHPSTTDDLGTTRVTEGYVYLLKSGNHYKIGRSDEIEKRIKQITIALPEKVELIHTIRTDDPPGIEAYWHRRFSQQRANGEWFSLSSADIKAFRRRKFQ